MTAMRMPNPQLSNMLNLCVGEDHDDGDDDYHDGDDDDDHDEMRTDALPYQPMVIRLYSLAYS